MRNMADRQRKTLLFKYDKSGSVNKWLSKQKNKTLSIQQLIKIAANQLGYQDIVQLSLKVASESSNQDLNINPLTDKTNNSNSRSRSALQSNTKETLKDHKHDSEKQNNNADSSKHKIVTDNQSGDNGITSDLLNDAGLS